MLWYETSGKDNDVFVSSRIRLARNLCDYPFGKRLDEPSAKEILEKVKSVFDNEEGYTYLDLSLLGNVEKMAEADKHKISRELASKSGPCALIENDGEQLYIMVLEEDHIRIQSIKSGFSLAEAYDAALKADRKLDSSLRYAYDEKLGYLTHCPTNLGTGMRASVMMFLPALTYAGGIRTLQSQLGKIGLTIRGMSGEGSSADGCLYQISNQITLGTSEEEIISKLERVCENIAEQERELRKSIYRDAEVLSDRVMRSYGTLLYAVLLDSTELAKLYTDVRLGVALGIIEGVSVNTLDKILVTGMSGVIMSENEKVRTPRERDRARAEAVRRVLGGK